MTEPQIERDASRTPRHIRVVPPESTPAEPDNTPQQYELLLTKLARAQRELEGGSSEGRNAYLEAASAIVFDLLYSLDFKRGGELVPRLAAIYGYIGNELLTISRTGDAEQLEHLSDMITTLRQSWYDGTDTP